MDIIKREDFFPLIPFFDDFITKNTFNKFIKVNDGNKFPQANILETYYDYQIEIAVPGRQKKDFCIMLDNGILVIKSDTAHPDDAKEGSQTYSSKEFDLYPFQRSFHLPDTIEEAKIEATYQDGILRLIIPKKEEARKKPVRVISIS